MVPHLNTDAFYYSKQSQSVVPELLGISETLGPEQVRKVKHYIHDNTKTLPAF